jgi:hypothetical protein
MRLSFFATAALLLFSGCGGSASDQGGGGRGGGGGDGTQYDCFCSCDFEDAYYYYDDVVEYETCAEVSLSFVTEEAVDQAVDDLVRQGYYNIDCLCECQEGESCKL